MIPENPFHKIFTPSPRLKPCKTLSAARECEQLPCLLLCLLYRAGKGLHNIDSSDEHWHMGIERLHIFLLANAGVPIYVWINKCHD